MASNSSFVEEVIIKIPMEDQPPKGGWSVRLSRETDDNLVYVTLHYNNKDVPTHVASLTIEEFDSVYNKLRG
jgi:hypothetical protein